MTMTPLSDPLEFGYHPVGLPHAWRRIRADMAAGQPAAMWLDSTAVGNLTSTDEVTQDDFVSSAIVMGWMAAGMSTSIARLAALAADVTRSTPGWTPRDQRSGGLPFDGFSVQLFGTVASPFGPLVSNSHTIACPVGDGNAVVIQLAVTAVQDWADAADGLVLEGTPGSGVAGQ
jgi:hypothetical protein